MYILDNNNRLTKASEATFSQLNFKERPHLQEWIADAKDCLGEPLLIIAKEFDGFSETRERLDLLAIDKDKHLVVIENKLDDSGSEVTWQALKYASYCSTLSKKQIVDIFADFLKEDEEIAKQKIMKFLGVQDFEHLELNVGDNSQRIIFVAGNFRKEVMSSVQWLSGFGLDLKCIRASVYRYEDHVLVDFDQIFPTEVTDYLIKMAEKKLDGSKNISSAVNARMQFWRSFIEYSKNNNGIYADNSSSLKDNCISKGIGISGIDVACIVTGQECRSQLTINFGGNLKTKNKKVFDYLYGKKEEIQQQMPDYILDWDRMDDNVSCRIHTDLQKSYLNEGDVISIMEFLCKSSSIIYKVFGKYIGEIKHKKW